MILKTPTCASIVSFLQPLLPKLFIDSKAHLFFNTKWKKVGDSIIRIPVWYLIYKLVGCVFLLTNLVYWLQDTSVERKYMIHLTHWGIFAINLAVLLETVLTTYLYSRTSSSCELDKWTLRCVEIVWGLVHCTYLVSLGITCLYWSLVYDNTGLRYMDFYLHGLQGIFSFLDQLVSDRPWRVCHWWTAFTFYIPYLVFNVTYWAGGGTREDGEDYIYAVINWTDSPQRSVLVFGGALLLILILHFVLCMITCTRDKIHKKLFHITECSDITC